MCRYIPSNTSKMVHKYEVFINGKLVLTTFDRYLALCEREMSAGKCEIRVTRKEKSLISRKDLTPRLNGEGLRYR